MKVIKKSSITNHAEKLNALVEKAILQKIKSPFLVKLHYAFQTDSNLYFVLDYLNGGELFYHLCQERRFSEKRARFYVAEIILALEKLHEQKIIYRDLKPENVLLDA